jgi:hypothetical protein
MVKIHSAARDQVQTTFKAEITVAVVAVRALVGHLHLEMAD